MKILAIFVVLAIASVSSDVQKRPVPYPSIRIYHPEYKIPIARPYTTIKRESATNAPVVITPSRQFKEDREEVKEDKPKPKRQVTRPPVVKVEEKEEFKKSSASQRTRSIADDKSARSYSFGYVIKDQDSFNDFEQQEKRDGDVVTGSYRVSLPDGRTQFVTYRSSPETGNVMKVTYEGEAQYPDIIPVSKEKRAPAPSINQPLKSNQVIKSNRQIVKNEQKESPKPTTKLEATKPNIKIKGEAIQVNHEDTKTSNKNKEEVIKANHEVKAVYSRPSPSPPPAKTVTLPVKYSAQYKTIRPAPSVELAEPIPTPEPLVATTYSPAAPSESLLSLISENLPNPDNFSAPSRGARIVESPNKSDAKPVKADLDDIFEIDGPLPIPAAFRNSRRIANLRIVNPKRRQVVRWW